MALRERVGTSQRQRFRTASATILDAESFAVLSEISLLPREEITSITPVTLLTRRYIAIGTAVFASDAEFDDAAMDGDFRVTAKEGRMLLVEPAVDAPTGEWKSEVVVIVKTVGPVHDVAVIHGFLAIAAASKVSEARNRLRPLRSMQCILPVQGNVEKGG